MKLTRPLFRESPAFRRERWIRFGLLTPVAAFAGGLWGSLLGTGRGIVAGAGIFVAGAWLYTRLHPALVQAAERRFPRGGALASLLFDVGVAGGGGLILTRGLGLPWSSAVGAALAGGGAVALGMARFFGEGGTRFFQTVVSPVGRPGRVGPAYSQIEALMAQGDHEGARRACEALLADHPRDVEAWVRLARLLAGPLSQPDEALDCLVEGLGRLKKDPAGQQRLLKQVVLIHQGRREPLRALPLLARYEERWGTGPQADWARETRRQLKAEHLSIEGDAPA